MISIESMRSGSRASGKPDASWIGSKDDDFVLVRRDALRSSDSKVVLDQVQTSSESKDPSEKKEGHPVEQDLQALIKGKNVCFAVGRSMGGGRSLPPFMDMTPHIRKTFRFYSTSVSGKNVTVGALLGACGTICTTANTGVTTMCSAVRLASVTIWPSASSSGNSFAELYFGSASTAFAPDKEVGRNIPQGVSVTGAVQFVPPPKSLASDWMNSTNPSLIVFYSQISVGSIIDVAVDACVSNTNLPVQITVATGTLGSVYYLALDGPSSHSYPPTNLNTTF